jgi:hypothetical protein
LQHALEQKLTEDGAADEEDNITIGVRAFKGVGEHGWTSP